MLGTAAAHVAHPKEIARRIVLRKEGVVGADGCGDVHVAGMRGGWIEIDRAFKDACGIDVARRISCHAGADVTDVEIMGAETPRPCPLKVAIRIKLQEECVAGAVAGQQIAVVPVRRRAIEVDSGAKETGLQDVVTRIKSKLSRCILKTSAGSASPHKLAGGRQLDNIAIRATRSGEDRAESAGVEVHTAPEFAARVDASVAADLDSPAQRTIRSELSSPHEISHGIQLQHERVGALERRSRAGHVESCTRGRIRIEVHCPAKTGTQKDVTRVIDFNHMGERASSATAVDGTSPDQITAR